MLRTSPRLFGVSLAAICAAASASGEELKDLYFGEALFLARQGYYFEALERLDTELGQHYGLDEPERDSLYYHINDAEFSVGDFELRYRMHHRAGRAITAVLEGDVDELVRNEAAYRLARIHFQKGQMADALQALARIDGRVPDSIRDDIEFLRANAFLSTGRPAEAAEILKRLQGSDELGGFASYNLGIALLQDGRTEAAVEQLDRSGRIEARDEPTFAIRDKSNMVLGTMLLESGDYALAGQYFDRVRLDGPFSNQALLSSGWAAMSNEDYDRAVVPWSLLAQREATDLSAQEAKLALPYAYGKLDVHGRAAEYYGRALDSFGVELEKLDTSILSIREGKFLEALVREEIRQDKDWVIRLRSLPEAPETYYLMELMAAHNFQTGLQNYLDLEDLRKKLASWESSFDAYGDMISIRRAHYEPLLPEIDSQFRALDSRMRLRLEQHKLLERRMQAMLTAPRPEFLATRDEQAMLGTIERIELRLQEAGVAPESDNYQRLKRLKGRLLWTLHTEYHERLAAFEQHLYELGAAIAVAEAQYEQFVRVRQAAVHSFEGYEKGIARMRTNVRESLATVNTLMARQGRLLEIVAIDELTARRERLEKYQNDARFALADSYDRATQVQARRLDE
ncbi:MAG: tetratricopeptide repeat protein [Gammaproteobacteria bacterium]|nr:tetratricopeptide repeat protein [Gammaproteobacteria bacterium]MDH4254771.1 tetratricopeptide repeat protein [Gammaproteobacteria bacterium]MDH5308317.1 tetratricopeptide repeat protein [Gammaproteobacteria bacterium]